MPDQPHTPDPDPGANGPSAEDRSELDQLRSALRRATEDLEQARGETRAARVAAERAEQVRKGFLANLGHEIRTPMTSITGFARSLQAESDLSPELRQQVEQIVHASDHLMGLVEDVIDLSRAETGKLSLDPEPFDFKELLDEVIATHQSTASTAGAELSLNVPCELPPRVMLDHRRSRQILSRLVSNALGFAQGGDVRVTVDHDAEDGQLTVTVADDGPFIPSREHERIFDTYQQASTTVSARTRTSSVGLAFVRHLARAMNGDITLTSDKDAGTVFTVTLPAIFLPSHRGRKTPASRVPAGTSEGMEAARLDGVAVLAVDDHEANRLLLQHVLTRAGAEVTLAGDGETALARFEARPADVIVLDVQMPGMDGYDTARALRRLPGGDRVPVLMLTAFASDDDRAKSRAAGANGYLPKPFNPADLVRDVARFHEMDLEPVNLDELEAAAASPSRLVATAAGGDSVPDDPEFAALTVEFLEHHQDRVRGYLRTEPGAETVKVWAHQLAGAGGSFGFPELTTRAREVEHALDEDTPVAGVKDDLIGISNLLRTLLQSAKAVT